MFLTIDDDDKLCSPSKGVITIWFLVSGHCGQNPWKQHQCYQTHQLDC
jgi:hypothetical protein